MENRQKMLATVGVIMLAASLGGCADLIDSRKGMDIQTVLGADVYLVESEADVRDTTESVCPTLEHCVQSAESDRVRIIRFDDKSAAADEVAALGDAGYQSDWFAVDFLQPVSTTQKEREYVQSSIDGVWSDSPD